MKVAIATTQPDGYWTLGNRWTPTATVLEESESSIESPHGEDAVKAFHDRAKLIATGKITREDIARAKLDARLVVVDMTPPAPEKAKAK